MSDSKQKIISELKSKITQFKSKLKSHKSQDVQDKQEIEEELVLKLPINKVNKDINNNNKENININNNIMANNQIKTSKNERANSTYASSFNITKKYLDFDFDKLLSKTKTNSNSKTNIHIDELNNVNNKNKTFINLNLTTKKIISKTDRQKELFNSFNNEYTNKYEANNTEPNIYNYNSIKPKNNNSLFRNKYLLKEDMIPLSKIQIQNDRERLSAKPEIRTDASRYNLNFMMNNYNKNKNRKNSAKLFYNNSLNKIENSKDNNYSMKINKILKSDSRKNNFNSLFDLNNKYLTSSKTIYNYNTYNAFNNFNKRNRRKNYFEEFENNKSTNYKINLDDIHKIKYTIQNLSNREINNLPISIFKEMKELYDLIYIKFLKDNCI